MAQLPWSYKMQLQALKRLIRYRLMTRGVVDMKQVKMNIYFRRLAIQSTTLEETKIKRMNKPKMMEYLNLNPLKMHHCKKAKRLELCKNRLILFLQPILILKVSFKMIN